MQVRTISDLGRVEITNMGTGNRYVFCGMDPVGINDEEDLGLLLRDGRFTEDKPKVITVEEILEVVEESEIKEKKKKK